MRKKLLTMFGSVCLILVLAALPFMAACPAPPEEAPAPPPEEEEAPPPPPPEEKLPDVFTIGSRGKTLPELMSLAVLLEKHLGIPVIYTETGGSTACLPMMQNGEIDFTACGPRDTAHALHGTGEFEDIGKMDVCVVYAKDIFTYFGFVTTPKTGIKSIEDLAGKKVCFREARSITTTEMGTAVLEYYDLLDKVVGIPDLTIEEVRDALAEGRIDAAFQCYINIPKIVAAIPDLIIIGIPKEAGEYAHNKHSYISWWEVPEGFDGLSVAKGTGGITMIGQYICRASLDEYTVYRMLKAIYENFDEYAEMWPKATVMGLDKQSRLAPHITAPYHPGAVRYYKEAGVWTPEMEEIQQKLLAEL